jgi:cytidine deaminase
MSDMVPNRDALIAAAEAASTSAYAPYSGFHVGAALAFADGSVVTGANVENASYGLTLCAETSAVATAMNQGRRGGLVAIAITASRADGVPLETPVTPCGRCRQVIEELAGLGATDPVVWCAGGDDLLELRLSDLLPYAFRKDNFRS